MDIIFLALSTLSSLIQVYMLVCLVRVFITWVPSLAYSSFGRLLSQIADPWLNIFRKFNPFKRQGIDISPIFAFAVLMLLSNVFTHIASSKNFSLTIIIAITISLVWSVISSLFTFFNIIVLVRLIATLLNKNQGQIWQSIDQLLHPVIQKVIPIFTKNRFLQLKYSLMILLAIGLVAQYGIGFAVSLLTSILA